MATSNGIDVGIANSTTDPRHRRFLRDEFHRLTLAATVQRGNVYRKGLPEAGRMPLHETLRTGLERISAGCASAISDDAHSEAIVDLAELITAHHRASLSNGRFRIGSAQKALNLFLKYLWCNGVIPTPPHCPFDARVIAHLPPTDRCAWTSLDDMAGYHRLVVAARKAAGDRSLAEWELDLYSAVSISAVRAANFGRAAI